MKTILPILAFLTLLISCKNQTAPEPAKPATAPLDAAAILKHNYWVSKPYHDALFAGNVPDTLAFLPCSEIIFIGKDTLTHTACNSDAGIGIFKPISSNSIEIKIDGMDGKVSTATVDEQGVLHLKMPEGMGEGWPTEYVPVDGVIVNNADEVTTNLLRKRIAGSYTLLPEKGKAAITSLMELRMDGTQVGLGTYSRWEPWNAGIGSTAIQNPPMNLFYLNKNDKADTPVAFAWQMHGDTLRLFDTKQTSKSDDLPEFKVTKLKATYLRAK